MPPYGILCFYRENWISVNTENFCFYRDFFFIAHNARPNRATVDYRLQGSALVWIQQQNLSMVSPIIYLAVLTFDLLTRVSWSDLGLCWFSSRPLAYISYIVMGRWGLQWKPHQSTWSLHCNKKVARKHRMSCWVQICMSLEFTSHGFSKGDHLAECQCVALGQVLFMKIRNLVHFADIYITLHWFIYTPHFP